MKKTLTILFLLIICAFALFADLFNENTNYEKGISKTNRTQNLISNPGCEDALVGGNIPHWVEELGSNWTQRNSNPTPYEGSSYFFAGVASLAKLTQTIDVSAYSSAIDTNNLEFYFSGRVRSYLQTPPDYSRVELEFWDSSQSVLLDVYDSGLHNNTNNWVLIEDLRFAPVGTRFIKIRLTSIRNSGSNNDGFFDDLYLVAIVIAEFSANQTNILIGSEIQFTDASVGNPSTWEWDFDNDGTIDSYEQNPTQTYTNTGLYTVSLTVSDGNSTDTEIKEDYITVIENSVPFVQNPIVDFSFNEDTIDSSIDLNNVFDDVDLIYGDELSFSFSGNVNIAVEISEEGIVTLTPNQDWNGSETITFTATDNYLEQISDEVVVTINPINDPPILNITGIFESEEDLPSQTYDFSQYCSQTWGEIDILILSADNSTHIDVTITDFDVVFESNTPDWNGTEDITIYLDDNVVGRRDVVSQVIQVTINPVNDAPTIILPDDFTFDEDGTLVEDFSQYINDVDPDDLTLSVTGNTEIIVDIVGTEVTLSATANWNGIETLIFTVDDNATRATAEDDVDVIVTPINDPPILNITGTFETDEDLPSSTYNFSQYCSQTWGETDILTLNADNATHIDITITDFDVVFESNTPNWNGTEDITIYLDDNVVGRRDVVSQVIQVTINPVNDAPTIILPNDFTFEEDSTLVEDFSQYIDDVDPDDLTLSVTGNTEIIVDIVGTIVTFSATENWNGTETLTFTVDDNVTDATAEDDVDVIVIPVNDEPEIIGFIPEELTFTVIQDSTVAFSVDVEDIDSDLNYEWLVDDDLQNETTFEFIYQFVNLGNIEIKSIVSDEEYEIETIWSVEVEPGSGINDLLPAISKLHQNYPNPFNPSTTIKYNLNGTSNSRIEIYNIKGQNIISFVNHNQVAGYHSVVWVGNDSTGNPVSSGLYLYKLVINNRVIDMKKC
ncbi:MAG: tandem-95 repeat protein [Bacteroidales bacterium]|nr:tandem-95 repeat protein [Bacteroidales bacterium]